MNSTTWATSWQRRSGGARPTTQEAKALGKKLSKCRKRSSGGRSRTASSRPASTSSRTKRSTSMRPWFKRNRCSISAIFLRSKFEKFLSESWRKIACLASKILKNSILITLRKTSWPLISFTRCDSLNTLASNTTNDSVRKVGLRWRSLKVMSRRRWCPVAWLRRRMKRGRRLDRTRGSGPNNRAWRR